jgi:hypothetical protein
MKNQLWQEDTWLQYLPSLHRELAAPEIENGLPRSFVSLNFDRTCAWWETLRYLFRSLLGWKSIPAGLAWWYEAGKPALDDPCLRLVLERWDTRRELDYFAAREWVSRGYTGGPADGPAWPSKDYEPMPGWWQEFQNRPQLMEYGPYGGGTNPLHLSHSDMLAEQSSNNPLNGSHELATRTATLIVHSFDSWQKELIAYGSSLPSLVDRSWKVEVFDRSVGYLGLFRQSRVTGHWFQGKHSVHMAGNPTSDKNHPSGGGAS